MTIDTSPEIEAEAARVLACILHPESPVPVPIAFDMLQDAGCEDRSDVAFELFHAASEMLLKELGEKPDWHVMGPGLLADGALLRADAWRIFCNACEQAFDLAHKIRAQSLPSDFVVKLFCDSVKRIPGLGTAGIATTVKKMALENWRDRLPRILTMLREVEEHEAEDLTPKPLPEPATS